VRHGRVTVLPSMAKPPTPRQVTGGMEPHVLRQAQDERALCPCAAGSVPEHRTMSERALRVRRGQRS
jgi:hypothetical protein